MHCQVRGAENIEFVNFEWRCHANGVGEGGFANGSKSASRARGVKSLESLARARARAESWKSSNFDAPEAEAK